jgi:hypothetical protein
MDLPKGRWLLPWLLACTALCTPAAAQEPSGTAVQVDPDAEAAGVTGTRVLQAPGDIFQRDLITTDANGRVQIEFVDDTRFIVGPNATVTIDEFVFNPNQTAQSVVFSATKGTFRFISGNSPSDAYTVNTPTMTVGVRGSAFNLAVLIGGRSLLQWLEDEGFACVEPAEPGIQGRVECIDLSPGDLVGASPGGGFDNFRPGEINHLIIQLFPTFGSTPVAPGFQTQNPPRPPPLPPNVDSYP